MRDVDNRDLSEMEAYYLARIEALQAEIANQKQLIDALLTEKELVA